MTHGDLDPVFELPYGAEIVKGAKLYMIPVFRAITCPNGELVFLRPCDIQDAFKDLSTWALPVSKKVLNQ